MTNQASGKQILLFIPAFNCSLQLARLLEDLHPKLPSAIREILIIDNCSTDETLSTAKRFIEKHTSTSSVATRLLQNESNCGLGGSHKNAYRYACEHGFHAVVTLHGDDQANLEDFRTVIDDWSQGRLAADAVLGSRFATKSVRRGYALHRSLGNHALNLLWSIILCRPISDIGSGLNLISVEAVRKLDLSALPDTLVFNSQQLLELLRTQCRVIFWPISWSEEDQKSNAIPWKVFVAALWQVLMYRLGIKPKSSALTYSSREIANNGA